MNEFLKLLADGLEVFGYHFYDTATGRPGRGQPYFADATYILTRLDKPKTALVEENLPYLFDRLDPVKTTTLDNVSPISMVSQLVPLPLITAGVLFTIPGNGKLVSQAEIWLAVTRHGIKIKGTIKPGRTNSSIKETKIEESFELPVKIESAEYVLKDFIRRTLHLTREYHKMMGNDFKELND